MASTFTPVILSATLTPNPAKVGQTVLLSVAVQDVESTPSVQVYLCGEFYCGEV